MTNHYIATGISGIARHLIARNEIEAMRQAKEIGLPAPSIELVESNDQLDDELWPSSMPARAARPSELSTQSTNRR